MWTQREAIDTCCKIENICPTYGCHVALTGGTLYKEGNRKDLDILFYRIRQVKDIDIIGLINALEDKLGFALISTHGWMVKMVYGLKKIDVFFPENAGEEYISE